MEEFTNFFENYANNYIKSAKADSDEITSFIRKKEHSYRVRDNMLKISKDENLKLDCFIIEFIGLFHDIGRFYQYEKYKTFSDKASCDHGELSVRILKEQDFFSKIDKRKSEIIVNSILLHNKKDLPKLKDKELYKYAGLLRDADKLDGFYQSSLQTGNIKNTSFYKGKLEEPTISDTIYNLILNNETIDKCYIKTILETQIVTLSYITSDICYDSTIRIIKSEEYVKKMFFKMSQTPRSREIYEFVEMYIKRRLEKNEK